VNVIWLDLETTGLDPSAGHILEIGMVATRLPTFEVVAEWDAVILPSVIGRPATSAELASMFKGMHPTVQEMHTKSGLWEEVPNGVPLAAAMKKAREFFNNNAGRTDTGQSPMAGANPSFDRGWLKAQGPETRALEKLFSYRHFDVRTITQLQSWVFGIPYQNLTPQHRALDDCHDAIHAVRKFLEVV
jgi:oligoribonuclease